MIRIPTPIELLRLFQKIDPSLFMVNVASLGIVSYGSKLHSFGFVVGIDPETGHLTAIVGQQNIYVSNETSNYMDLESVMDWFRERFNVWKEIPVEGRTVSKTEEAALLGSQADNTEDDGESEMELTDLVKDIISGKVINEIVLPGVI